MTYEYQDAEAVGVQEAGVRGESQDQPALSSVGDDGATERRDAFQRKRKGQ